MDRFINKIAKNTAVTIVIILKSVLKGEKIKIEDQERLTNTTAKAISRGLINGIFRKMISWDFYWDSKKLRHFWGELREIIVELEPYYQGELNWTFYEFEKQLNRTFWEYYWEKIDRLNRILIKGKKSAFSSSQDLIGKRFAPKLEEEVSDFVELIIQSNKDDIPFERI